MRESKLQQDCIRYLNNEGIVVFNIHGGGWSSKGAPDLICCVNGKFVAFELKVDDNNMQSDQRLWKKRIVKNGGGHYCPRSLPEFITIVKGLRENERT